MKIFFDTEFQERADGALDFISIGMVRDDGAEHYHVQPYAIINGVIHVNREPVSGWVSHNVFKHIPWPAEPTQCNATRNSNIVDFCGDSPEFWADYGAYDWVTLCQLFGTMMDLPKGWPMFSHDLQQLLDYVALDFGGLNINPKPGNNDCGNRELLRIVGPEQDPATLHHALHDARHLKAQYDFIQSHLD